MHKLPTCLWTDSRTPALAGHLFAACPGPVLAVSPHLDDAALSAGAVLVGLAGERAVTVVTLFAGDPPPRLSPVARRHHARCGLDGDAVAVRRGEDRRAMALLGAVPVHCDLPDAVYRPRPDGGWACTTDEAMFAAPPLDPALDDRLAEVVTRAAVASDAGLLLGPASVGGHVDHVLARRAVGRVARRCGLPLLLWRDEPYATWLRPDVRETEIRVAYTPTSLRAKLAAVGCYASQLGMLWPEGDWRSAISRAGGRPPGEVFVRL